MKDFIQNMGVVSKCDLLGKNMSRLLFAPSFTLINLHKSPSMQCSYRPPVKGGGAAAGGWDLWYGCISAASPPAQTGLNWLLLHLGKPVESKQLTSSRRKPGSLIAR